MPDSSAPLPVLPQVSVLLVDDRPENLLTLEVVLEGLGQKLVRASSGSAALEAASRDRFAVILMDVRMPGLDGFETMAKLRETERSRRVPIIFVSAVAEEEHVVQSYAGGAVDYISKPIDADALRSKVAVFVNLHQHELALEAIHQELERRVAERTAELAETNRALAREIEERKAAEQRLLDRAFRDPLTGLANRALFMIHLNRAVGRARRRRDHGFAVLMIDVDRFKVINDSLGHLSGDKLLIELAARLVECLREIDTVARLGGDEFSVLLDAVTETKDATRLAERVLRALDAPFSIEGKEVVVSASIGITMMGPRYEKTEDLLRDADAAMYRAKEAGRARCQLFDVEMHMSVMAQLNLESELRRALEKHELVVFYQPIVDVVSGRPVAVEALVRWQHPERGCLGPDVFIPIAEETGLIRPIGRWVFGEACRQLAEWKRAGLDLVMGVNLSAHELAQPDLLEELERILTHESVDARSISIEVTESAVMTTQGAPEKTLEHLASLGVSISLDDFGTGYSCLAYLHRFPVRTLKIDRSFVSRLGDDTEDGVEIVKTIVAMATNLGMTVTAEGVETAQQLACVRSLGCHHAQGFFFAEALEPAAALAFLEKHASRV